MGRVLLALLAVGVARLGDVHHFARRDLGVATEREAGWAPRSA